MRLISADKIYTITDEPLENHVIVISSDGFIKDIINKNKITEQSSIEYFKGSICPGLINAHCHLELSHLHHKIPQKTGIVEFIQQILKQRNKDTEELIFQAMVQADKMMENEGIVAVGDICNDVISARVKSKSKIFYHSFIELIGFHPERSKQVFEDGITLLQQFKSKLLSATLVPHAPYSVSVELLKTIATSEFSNPFTIHNQESETENSFFQTGNGNFLKLYASLGMKIDHHHPQQKNSLPSIFPHISEAKKIALVHNTFTDESDIEFVQNKHSDIYWCMCLNANKYIENTVPDLHKFLRKKTKIIIGTDSLASNESLSLLTEIKTIRDYFPQVTLNQALTWATLNGAEFLGINSLYGTIEKGKKPGLIHFDENKYKVLQVII